MERTRMKSSLSPDSVGDESTCYAATVRPHSDLSDSGNWLVTLRKPGDDEGEMSEFVRQALVNMLKPLSEHVRDLQNQVQDIHRTVTFNCARSNENNRRLELHDEHFKDLEKDIADTKGAAARVKADVTTLHDHRLQDERAVASLSRDFLKLKQVLEATATDIQELKADQVHGKSDIEKLKASGDENFQFAEFARKEMLKLRQLSEGIWHEHEGLCRRLEDTRRIVEDATMGLAKLKHLNANQHKESQVIFERHTKKLKNLQKTLEEVSEQTNKHQHTLDPMVVQVRKLCDQLGILHASLLGKDEEGDGEVTVHNIRADLTTVAERLKNLQSDVASLNAAVHDELGPHLRDVSELADTNATRIADHDKEFERMGSIQEREVAHLSKTSSKLDAQELRADELEAARDLLIKETQSLNEVQTQHRGTLDNHDQEHVKTRTQCSILRQDLDSAVSRLTKLTSDHKAVSENVAQNTHGLDVAHEYLQGMGKGFQDVHNRVIYGQDGLLCPKPGHTMMLPVLPGAKKKLQVGRD